MSLRLELVQRTVGKEMWIHETSLELETGQLYVLLGPTLAGKTSLMRLMAGLDRPTSGRVFMDGQDVTTLRVQKRGVAMVYQQFINYPTMTVFDNIASPLRIKGESRAAIDGRVRETASMLHIEHLLGRLPAELSGGQQQRLAIARALVKDARLLLLDEPLVNLDYKLREELRAELRDLFAKGRTTVVYATTEPLEALIMGGRSIVMKEGRILQTGPTRTVYHRPASLGVASVFSDPPINMLSVTVRDGAAQTVGGLRLPLSHHLSALPPDRYTLGVRANHLSTRRQSEADLEIDAVVDLAEISGSETFVHVRTNDFAWVVQEEGVHEHALGQQVKVYLDPEQLYAFGSTGALELAPPRALARA